MVELQASTEDDDENVGRRAKFHAGSYAAFMPTAGHPSRIPMRLCACQGSETTKAETA
jgi:hypothetical protein